MASHDQVAHSWAHKLNKARTGHNMFHNGVTIYSYGHHFPIARHVELPNGDPAVLLTTKGYSSSTSGHISTVRSAASHLKILMVTDPTTTPNLDDVTALMAEAETQMVKARRARTRSQMYIDDAARRLDQANQLIVAFQLPRALLSLDGLAPDLAAVRAAAAQARFEAETLRVQRQAQQRDAWLANQPHTAFRGTDEHGNAYCRVSADQTMLETSQGVAVPLADAKRVFAFLIKVRQTAAAPVVPRALRVGDFAVDRIDVDGSFKAGCHKFAWPEIARVAQSIGLSI